MPRNLPSRPSAVTTPRPVAPHPSSLGVRVLPVVVALAVLASLLPATARAGDLSPSSRVSTAGLGPVKVGMTKGQAERAGGTRLIWSGRAIRGCRYLRPLDRSIRASFMVVNRRIARVDVASRGIRTVSGFRVGDDEQAIREHFGHRLHVSRHEYLPRGRYLEVIPRERRERNRRVIFETDGERVTYIRAGRLPEVRYVEGCV